MKSFELLRAPDDVPRPYLARGMGKQVLLRNAFWFMTFRWIVVAVFVISGLVGRFAAVWLSDAGLVLPYRGLWILAAVLCATNLTFYVLARRLQSESSERVVRANVWLQIITDLIVVTFLVHIVGSTYTFIPFTYLFHITLSCIFFPKKASFLVTLFSAVLYFGTVAVELAGIWPAQGILASAPRVFEGALPLEVIFAVSAVFVWFVEWYLVASLAEAVRQREEQLSLANRQLREADQEKTRQVLLTTHDLKAPFAGIESNIEVLKSEYWKQIPDSVREIIERIDQRAQTLRERIRDILILGDLRSRRAQSAAGGAADLRKSVEGVVEELAEKAHSRNVSLQLEVPPLVVSVEGGQLAILLSNLIANAILYSHEGGTVVVSAERVGEGVLLSVADSGIGIREEALPHVFDEYYRTKEAARFNRNSTGLGLAIVKEIAWNLNLGVIVESAPGEGTTFKVLIPESR